MLEGHWLREDKLRIGMDGGILENILGVKFMTDFCWTLSRPELLTVPFLFLMKDFFTVTVRENGDSTMLKSRFYFLMLPSKISQVLFASIVTHVVSLK